MELSWSGNWVSRLSIANMCCLTPCISHCLSLCCCFFTHFQLLLISDPMTIEINMNIACLSRPTFKIILMTFSNRNIKYWNAYRLHIENQDIKLALPSVLIDLDVHSRPQSIGYEILQSWITLTYVHDYNGLKQENF